MANALWVLLLLASSTVSSISEPTSDTEASGPGAEDDGPRQVMVNQEERGLLLSKDVNALDFLKGWSKPKNETEINFGPSETDSGNDQGQYGNDRKISADKEDVDDNIRKMKKQTELGDDESYSIASKSANEGSETQLNHEKNRDSRGFSWLNPPTNGRDRWDRNTDNNDYRVDYDNIIRSLVSPFMNFVSGPRGRRHGPVNKCPEGARCTVVQPSSQPNRVRPRGKRPDKFGNHPESRVPVRSVPSSVDESFIGKPLSLSDDEKDEMGSHFQMLNEHGKPIEQSTTNGFRETHTHQDVNRGQHQRNPIQQRRPLVTKNNSQRFKHNAHRTRPEPGVHSNIAHSKQSVKHSSSRNANRGKNINGKRHAERMQPKKQNQFAVEDYPVFHTEPFDDEPPKYIQIPVGFSPEKPPPVLILKEHFNPTSSGKQLHFQTEPPFQGIETALERPPQQNNGNRNTTVNHWEFAAPRPGDIMNGKNAELSHPISELKILNITNINVDTKSGKQINNAEQVKVVYWPQEQAKPGNSYFRQSDNEGVNTNIHISKTGKDIFQSSTQAQLTSTPPKGEIQPLRPIKVIVPDFSDWEKHAVNFGSGNNNNGSFHRIQPSDFRPSNRPTQGGNGVIRFPETGINSTSFIGPQGMSDLLKATFSKNEMGQNFRQNFFPSNVESTWREILESEASKKAQGKINLQATPDFIAKLPVPPHLTRERAIFTAVANGQNVIPAPQESMFRPPPASQQQFVPAIPQNLGTKFPPSVPAIRSGLNTVSLGGSQLGTEVRTPNAFDSQAPSRDFPPRPNFQTNAGNTFPPDTRSPADRVSSYTSLDAPVIITRDVPNTHFEHVQNNRFLSVQPTKFSDISALPITARDQRGNQSGLIPQRGSNDIRNSKNTSERNSGSTFDLPEDQEPSQITLKSPQFSLSVQFNPSAPVRTDGLTQPSRATTSQQDPRVENQRLLRHITPPLHESFRHSEPLPLPAQLVGGPAGRNQPSTSNIQPSNFQQSPRDPLRSGKNQQDPNGVDQRGRSHQRDLLSQQGANARPLTSFEEDARRIKSSSQGRGTSLPTQNVEECQAPLVSGEPVSEVHLQPDLQ